MGMDPSLFVLVLFYLASRVVNLASLLAQDLRDYELHKVVGMFSHLIFKWVLGNQEFRLPDESYYPLLELFHGHLKDQMPVYVNKLLDMQAKGCVLPRPSCIRDYTRFSPVPISELQILMVYLDQLTTENFDRLTYAQTQEIHTLIYQMGNIFNVPLGEPYDCKLFVDKTLRIYEILGKDFGWHDVNPNADWESHHVVVKRVKSMQGF